MSTEKRIGDLDIEKDPAGDVKSLSGKLKLGSDGQPLIPQPSDDPEDPLNWPLWMKIAVLVQVALLAAIGTVNSAIASPVFVPISEEFGISVVRAGYQTTIAVATNGLGSFIWVPFAHVYGRRPVFLFSTLVGVGAALGASYATTFPRLLAARVFMGAFPAAMVLGPVIVADMFFIHQRGRAMGFFTMTMTNGSHLAPIIGGLLGHFLQWRWCFKFACICNGALFLVILFCLPETLYIRAPPSSLTTNTPDDVRRFTLSQHLGRLHLGRRFPQLRLRLSQFVWPVLRMAKYPSVLFPGVYYAAQYGLASILPSLTVAAIFKERYGWGVLQTGVAYGLSLTIGSALGELAAGMVVDAIIKRERRKAQGGELHPEARLQALWTGEILVPAGLLIFGFCVANASAHWSGAIIGMGIACFGVQVITTTCYTYAIDCHKPEAAEVSQLFTFIRQEFGMTFAFYAVPLGHAIGFQYEFLLFALLGSGAAFLPVVALMLKGAQMRQWIARREGTRRGEEIQ